MKMKTTKITAVISSLIAIAVLCSTMFTAPQIKAIDGKEANEVLITYHGNGGVTDDYMDSYVSEGGDIADNLFHKASSVFVSWNTKADGLGDTYTPGAEIPANCATLDLYAAWDDGMFNVIYNGNGGKMENGDETYVGGQAKPGDAVVTAENPGFEKEGHEFLAWNTKADGSGQRIDVGRKFQMIGRDFTLYAMWKEAEAPANSDNEPAKEDSEEAPASDGDKTDTSDDTNTEEKTDTADDTNSEAKASDNEEDGVHNVIYNGNGAKTEDGKETVSFDGFKKDDVVTFEASTLFAREGYRFVSWNTKADGSGQVCLPGKKFRMIDKDITFYAVWEEIKEDNSATDTSDKDSTTDTSKATDTEKKDTDTATKGEYQLTYVIDSDNMVVGGHYNKGDIVTTASFMGTEPEGKTFSHWSTTADDTGVKFPVGQTFAMPGAHVLLYAVFTDKSAAVNGCTVTYNSNYGDTDNETVVDGPYEHRAVVTAVSNSFKKDGYTFICWNTEADGSGTDVLMGDKFYMPSSDVVLYARWAVNGSAEAVAAQSGKYTSTTGSTYSGAVRTGVDNTIVFVASAVLIISLAVLVMCSIKGKKREE